VRRALAVLLLFAATGLPQSPAPTPEDEAELVRLLRHFVSAYQAVEENYADPVSPEQAFYGGALPGLLRTLDPFSAFLDPDQFAALRDMQQSVQKGFGSVVSIGPGRVIILQTVPGSPSARAGLSAGDEIVDVNGYWVGRLEIEQLVQLLQQSRQQPAQLLIRRPGVATLMRFTLVPAELASPSVSRAFLLRPGVGYIKIESFEERTPEEFRAALEKLGSDLKSLVLDLRDNPGGVFPAALEIAALFLEPGQVILSVRGRSGPPEEIKVPEGVEPIRLPLAVLINGKSASASEIVAGALQDHDRAAIVGEPSFGKGLVQRVFDLPESTGLALTTALYFTPSGRSIQRPLDQLQKALPPAGQAVERFRSDAGRALQQAGGITPDEIVYPPGLSRFQVAVEATSSVINFAQKHVSEKPNVPEDFEVTPELLDEFQHFLSQRQIRPSLSEWSANREYLRSRLKTEIFNLAFGVDKGDEVEAQRDPQVQAAIRAVEAQ
jgi:carboxyl-terminal processing protease